jgi:hypothetical protein
LINDENKLFQVDKRAARRCDALPTRGGPSVSPRAERMISCDHTVNEAYDLALRVGRGAARDYVRERQAIAPGQADELLGMFIIGLEEALASVIEGRAGVMADILEAAIEAFVSEADRWPAPGADPERLFDFDSLIG